MLQDFLPLTNITDKLIVVKLLISGIGQDVEVKEQLLERALQVIHHLLGVSNLMFRYSVLNMFSDFSCPVMMVAIIALNQARTGDVQGQSLDPCRIEIISTFMSGPTDGTTFSTIPLTSLKQRGGGIHPVNLVRVQSVLSTSHVHAIMPRGLHVR